MTERKCKLIGGPFDGHEAIAPPADMPAGIILTFVSKDDEKKTKYSYTYDGQNLIFKDAE